MKQEELRTQETSSITISELSKSETESYEEDDLIKMWHAAAFTLDETQHLLRISMTQKNPIFQEKHVYNFTFDNQAILDKYNILRPDLLSYIRKKLRNSSIEINAVLTEAQGNSKLRTSKDIFHDMMKTNPSLSRLQQAFGLEIES